MADRVRRLLVTGDPVKVSSFGMLTGPVVNWLERRDTPGQEGRETMIGTVYVPEDEAVVKVARESERFKGLTLQRIEGAGEGETYVLLHGEEGTGWPTPTE